MITLKRMLKCKRKHKRHRVFRFGLCAAFLCAVGAMISVSALKSRGLFFTTDFRKNEYPCRGAYITEDCGEINWEMFSHEPYDLVYIRAGQGGSKTDKMYEQNAMGAAKNGIPFGLVHEFDYGVSGIRQAKSFVKKLNNCMLLPVLDIRMGLIERILYPDDRNNAYEINAFADHICKEAGCGVILYCDEETYKRYDLERSGAIIWVEADCADNVCHGWKLLTYSEYGRSRAVKTGERFSLFTAGKNITKDKLFEMLAGEWIGRKNMNYQK